MAGPSSNAPSFRFERRPTIVAAMLLAASPLVGGQTTPSSLLTSGVWRGEQGRWTVVLEFSDDGAALSGVAHILEGAHEWSEAPISDVTLDPPRLEWHLSWGPGFQQDFRGQVDLERGSIAGEVSMADGRTTQARFDRAEREAVPGLLARAPRAESRWFRPPELDDGWKTTTPEESGLDRSHIEALGEEIVRGDAGSIHSLLIVENGRLVAEEYFHGWTREEPHPIASCTKSVVSLLVGIALDGGALESVDTPLVELLPELAQTAAQGWQSVRLEHLLTMTVGLERSESAQVEMPGPSLFLGLLQRPLAVPPGTKWEYANADVDLLGPILRQATGVDADEYARKALFEPLGIEVWEWQKSDDAYPSMASGLSLRPRDMAKIGALVANRGRWQGRQIVSEAWIERSTRVHVSPPEEFEQYGYLWWSVVPPGASEENRIAYAKGVGSQFILVVPARDLVITITGGNHANGKLMAIGESIVRHLLASPPPSSPPEATSESGEEEHALRDRKN